MPSRKQLVSVIVPIYNAEPFLAQCLESIIGQAHMALEIICLNDGSTDASLSIMRAYAAQDPRIRVIDKPNQGYGATCNRGIGEATGEWIAIVEPDDWIEPGMYADMLGFAASLNEPADIVKTPYWRIWMPDTPQQEKLNCSYRHRIKPKRQPFAVQEATHLLAHHPSIWSALYRKAFLDQHGIRFREYPGAGWADNPFLVETLCQTNRIAYLDKPYYCYREETPEKAAASLRVNPLMPLERWHDMQDALDHLGENNPRIMQVHAERGFTYLNSVAKAPGWPNPSLEPLVNRMLNRMNEQAVFSSSAISPGDKQRFAEARGVPLPTNASCKMPQLLHLAASGLYSIRNNGIRFALREVKRIAETPPATGDETP